MINHSCISRVFQNEINQWTPSGEAALLRSSVAFWFNGQKERRCCGISIRLTQRLSLRLLLQQAERDTLVEAVLQYQELLVRLGHEQEARAISASLGAARRVQRRLRSELIQRLRQLLYCRFQGTRAPSGSACIVFNGVSDDVERGGVCLDQSSLDTAERRDHQTQRDKIGTSCFSRVLQIDYGHTFGL